jgi:amidase
VTTTPDGDPCWATIAEAQAAMQEGRLTSLCLTERFLERVEAYDRGGPRLNAVRAR